jgi:hypothetical protein
MMRAIAASLLIVIGCSSGEETLDPAPVLEVTSPSRGTFADSDTVTVTGRVTDNGPVRVTVAGSEVAVGQDGTFSTTIQVGSGVEIIETHATDSAGQTVRDVRAVLAGSLGPTDGTMAGEVGARAGVSALRAVGNAVAAGAKQVDFTAAAQAMNPVYDNGGCLGATINITSIKLSNIGVALTPKANALATGVVIDNLDVRLSARFKVACISGSTTITLRASKTRINGDLGLRVASNKLQTSLPTTTVAFEGFSIDIGGVPGAIEDLLRGQARDGVSKALAAAIRSNVPPIADQQLAGLVANPVSTEILGRPATISVVPSAVSISPTELFVGLSTKVKVTGGEGGTFLTTPTTLSAGMSSSQGLGVALDDDIVNQLFAGLWSADAMEQQISIDSIPALGALLDDDGRTLDIKLSLPPTVSTDTGELVLAIGDMIVSVKDETGADVQRMAISIKTTLAAEPSQSGKILLTVGSPTVYAQVLAQSDAVDRPLTDSQVEALVTGVWGLIGVQADNALSALPMPTIAGITFGAPTIEAGNGFVLADMPIGQ